MNESHLVDIFDGKNTLGNVKPGDIFRESVVFDQHRHQVAPGQKLHDQVEVLRILERVVQLDHPR